MIALHWRDLAPLLLNEKSAGKTVVFTNGCFDILHAGHVRYLTEAKKLGDILVVGLNSDESVRKLKGAGRPVNPAADRAEVLSGLRAVDHVIVFGEDTAEELVRRLQPDLYVKGGDYSLDRLPESAIVAAYGGRTVLVPMVEGRSTTNVIRRLQQPDSDEINREGKDQP
jgi:rfaE bifunctional protein nucleotidyltransferase chain/domain